MNSFALDISDQSLKYGELLSTAHGLRLGRFGHERIPPGVIASGKIENEEELIRILKDLVQREHLHFVRISLPEEQMYLFTLKLPKITQHDLYNAVLLQIEEHIPLKAVDTIFDYQLVSEDEHNIFVQVLAIATLTIESYTSVFKKSGLIPISFELEAQAIARAVIPRGDQSSVMIIDFGAARTGASIAHAGKVYFTTTLDIGGNLLTSMIAKNFNISLEEAEEKKLSYGLGSAASSEDLFPAILNGVSVLRDELNRQYIYWKTHEDDGFKHTKIDRIILCGGESNLAGLSTYLEASMMLKVESANTWVNISTMTTSVPSLSYESSLGYATVLGLALADHMEKTEGVMNVLPYKEKKFLRHEYWIRFTTISLSFAALIFALSTLLFLPSYFFSVSKSNTMTSRLTLFNTENPEIAANTMDTAIKTINSKLVSLSTKDLAPLPSDVILKRLLLNLPKGITISQILYEILPKNNILSIHGIASDRGALKNFKKNLDSNPAFVSANIPISDFLEPTNIAFTISIILK